MVQRFLVILLVVGFAAMPYWLIASENSGCSASACDQVVVEAGEVAGASCCVQAEPDADDENAPTEKSSEHGGGCDCPLSCCGIAKTVATVTIKLRKAPVPQGAEHLAFTAQDVCGSPHIKRLKRPPRPMTIAA